MSFSNPQSTLVLLTPALYLLYLLWLTIYRLFFHRLRHIPGPISARVSTWYTTYHDLFRPGQLPFAIKDLHDVYGPIIRITPDEVHISDPEFLDTIYAMRNRNAPYPGGLMVEKSIGGAEDWDLHKLRRDALNPYFSVKAVGQMEELLRSKTDKFQEILDAGLREGDELNLSDAFFAYSNDVVRSFCFGSDNGLLNDLAEAKKQRVNLARLLTGVPLNKHFPWIGNVLAKGLPLVLGKKGIPPAVMDLIQFRAKAGKDIEAILSEKGIKPDHSVFYELRDSTILPPEEKTVGRLQDEATLLIMAGTESPAKSLSIAAFYLVQNPEVMSRLRQELSEARGQDGNLPLGTLLALPYLNAVAQEAHRLSFGVTRRLLRYSPTETLTFTAPGGPNKGTSYVLPPRTLMCSSSYCIHTNESLFPDPWTFQPERWIPDDSSKDSAVARDRSSEAINRRKRYMMSLGKGHRKCLGINLANAEVCLALSVLAGYQMRLFETDESDVKFKHDYQISHPNLASKGVRVVVEGHQTA